MFSQLVRTSTRGHGLPGFARRAFAAKANLNQLNLEHKRADGNAAGECLVQTYNKISPVGLAQFPSEYKIMTEANTPFSHAIMIRSHKLKEEEVPVTARCIARCGAGTNNIPVDRMSELGIPVFNTPGANANAVKELVLCGLLLASRKIHQGMNHMHDLGKQGLAKERVEKDKAMFGGRELKGKTLGVIGLGHIGAATACDAASLGMNIIGFDPYMSIKSALKMPPTALIVDNLGQLMSQADYISINIPYINKPVAEGGTHKFLDRNLLMSMKKDACILNFARGELVDSQALLDWFESGATGTYVSDFPDDLLWDHPNTLLLPHLGASTEEAEDQAAAMAAQTIQRFLSTGEIVNSVNFPEVKLESRPETAVRITISSANEKGVLAAINSTIADSNLNVLQQVNKSRGTVAYNVVDIELQDDSSIPQGKFKTWADLQESLTMLDHVNCTRFIAGGVHGRGYAVKRNGEYVV